MELKGRLHPSKEASAGYDVFCMLVNCCYCDSGQHVFGKLCPLTERLLLQAFLLHKT